MSRLGFTLILLSLGVAACGDPVAPGGTANFKEAAPAPPPSATEIHVLRQGPTATTFTALSVSAWIAKGRSQALEIEYTDPAGLADADPTIVLDYVRLDFPGEALLRRPDGSPIADGDSVLVTLSADPLTFRVALEPTGLEFDPEDPVRLRLRYQRAEPDLNEDGKVDAEDEVIRTNWLAVWLQDETSGAWTPIPAEHSLVSRKFDAPLEHFSNYAIAW